MAISPPSDLVLDVANAADPAMLRASMEKLQNAASMRAVAGPRFSRDSFASFQIKAGETEGNTSGNEAPNPAFRKFEAFMLQSFVESMFTGDNQAVFGQGIAGSYWKSMMAEAVATKMADAGGIGIARMLEQQADTTLARKPDQSQRLNMPNDPGRIPAEGSTVPSYQSEPKTIREQLNVPEPAEAPERG